MKPAINIHISELNLTGFSASDRYSTGFAVEKELQRLFREQGLPPSFNRNYSIGVLDAGTFNLKRGTKSGTTGSQIAGAVYKSIKRHQKGI